MEAVGLVSDALPKAASSTKNGVPRVKRYLDESKGLPAQDVWADIEPLRSWHAERLGTRRSDGV